MSERSLHERLSEARLHVRQAEERIEEQLALIEQLKADGHDIDIAVELLSTFLEILDQFNRHCEELEEKTGRLP